MLENVLERVLKCCWFAILGRCILCLRLPSDVNFYCKVKTLPEASRSFSVSKSVRIDSIVFALWYRLSKMCFAETSLFLLIG